MTPRFPYKAIIFDMDGTLVDTESVWQDAEAAMMQERGVIYTKEIRSQVLGLRVDEFFDKLRHLLKLRDTTEALRAELESRVLHLLPTETIPMPGAAEIIAFAVENNIPRAIAYSSGQVVIEAVVKSQGWEEAIPVRVSADLCAKGKPAPDVYLKTAEILGVAPADCVALEDSPVGARAAVAAGMTCLVISDPAHSVPADFAEITPHVYTNLHDVLRDLK